MASALNATGRPNLDSMCNWGADASRAGAECVLTIGPAAWTTTPRSRSYVLRTPQRTETPPLQIQRQWDAVPLQRDRDWRVRSGPAGLAKNDPVLLGKMIGTIETLTAQVARRSVGMFRLRLHSKTQKRDEL